MLNFAWNRPTRARTEIAGKPLTDGYHFGQTVVNDFGRPDEQGFNNVSGMSGWAADGPFAVYARGRIPAFALGARLATDSSQAISKADFGPLSCLSAVPGAA